MRTEESALPSPRESDRGWESRTGKAGFLLACGSREARPDQEFPAEQTHLLLLLPPARAATLRQERPGPWDPGTLAPQS